MNIRKNDVKNQLNIGSQLIIWYTHAFLNVLYIHLLIHFYWCFFIANSTNQFITLEFKTLNTECSYDYIFVYDGDSFNSPILGSFSGKNQPQSILASSGFVSISIT